MFFYFFQLPKSAFRFKVNIWLNWIRKHLRSWQWLSRLIESNYASSIVEEGAKVEIVVAACSDSVKHDVRFCGSNLVQTVVFGNTSPRVLGRKKTIRKGSSRNRSRVTTGPFPLPVSSQISSTSFCLSLFTPLPLPRPLPSSLPFQAKE